MKALANDKASIILQIQEHGESFIRDFVICDMKAWMEFYDDDDIFNALARHTGVSLMVASHRIRNDKKRVSEFIKDRGGFFEYASDELQDDEDVVLIALDYDDDPGSVNAHLSERLEELLDGRQPSDAIALLKSRQENRRLRTKMEQELSEKHEQVPVKI